ncbi:54S ribosomal protein L17 mitochondrial [Tulasnella sp. JGI-2019a]|nr:54S ribosomal protein L17 mitochondrial [Tulasnella sp. JGI-2019a]KAG9015423.1 54S ribosomal protein L17 mitochondrial [Tulasnella sp. JGI-2019a]
MAHLGGSIKRISSKASSSLCRRTLATEVPIPPSGPRLSTSIILNRSPLLTPKPDSFVSSYNAYQYKLSRALSTPFPQHFYFNKGSTLQQRFHNEEIDRDHKSFGAGFGKGARLRLPPESYDKPLPRESEADRTGDVKSLDRNGDRNLYLVVKNGAWKLPQAVAAPGDALHVAARKQLLQQCGEGMDTWIVGRQPVGFFEDEEKIFFFKAHIFAGQVAKDASSMEDFAWLTKQEIANRVDEKYWSGIKDMLLDV